MYLLLLEGTYSKFKLSRKSQKDLTQWMEENDIREPVAPDELHVSLVSARKKDMNPNYFQWVKNRPKKPNPILLEPPFKFNFRDFGSAVVLIVQSPVLDAYFKDTFKFDHDYDFSEFVPHITVSYNADANKHLKNFKGTGTVLVRGQNLIGYGTRFTKELKPGTRFNTVGNDWAFQVIDILSDRKAIITNKSKEILTPVEFIVSRKIDPPNFPIELVNDELVEPWNPDEGKNSLDESESGAANVTTNVEGPSLPISKKLKIFTRWQRKNKRTAKE